MTAMVYIAVALLNITGIYIICTQEIIDSNHWQRHASQMIARLKEDGSVGKFPKPVIQPATRRIYESF